jgi:8-oxo-dGTP pyrophosphatase MutT (NUDIX family)
MGQGERAFDQARRRIREALASRAPRRISLPSFQRAAVLVPVLRRDEGPTLLFTRRADGLRRHRGEISFPGGHLEAAEDACAAALREAHEEVALDPGAVEVVGDLDDRPSVTQYLVTPVVGLVADPPERFGRDEREVEEVFEVPLARLLDPRALRFEWWDGSRIPPGAPRRPLLDLDDEEVDRERGRYRVYFFEDAAGPGRVIWGLTARVLKDLLDRAFAFAS